MGERKKHLQSLYLEPEKASELDELAETSRIPKAVLLREAVDMLLKKYEKYEWTRTRAPNGNPVSTARMRKPKP